MIHATVLATTLALVAQQKPPVIDAIGLERGLRTISTPDYELRLTADGGNGVGLVPRNSVGFDFLASDRLNIRKADGFVHLGDISFRARSQGAAEYKSFSTYQNRKPAVAISSKSLSEHDLTPCLSVESPVTVSRRWEVKNGRLQLLFTLTNRTSDSVEIGSLGIPMPFNNIIMDRSLEEAHAKCSFTDPYIGQDAGFLRVTQLNGTGPTMVVTPVGSTPLEAWNYVREPLGPNQVFEGMMEWMVHTRAHAESEWNGVQQWNEPTSGVLKPRQARTYGVQFTPSKSIREIENTLAGVGRPVAVGLPGYVLPMDQTGKLFLKYRKPVSAIEVLPRDAAEVSKAARGAKGWMAFDVKPKAWGRVRVSVKYQDGTLQTINYYNTKPAAVAVADLGRFLTNEAWFTDANDPFGRAPSAITYDNEAKAQVLQDSRVWIAGLGDEGGSGNWLALAMKEMGQPNPEEVAKLESFVDKVLWGNLQFKDGPRKYGVRKSTFFYDPKALPDYPYDKKFNWTSWTSWSKEASNDIGRGYNYPHVVAAYYSLYKIARNYPGLAKAHDWKWYLNQAFRTTEYLTSFGKNGEDVVGYWRLGLMEGSVFIGLLNDLKAEGWTDQARLIESKMAMRADRWKNEPYPFGSEMAWDSTGQEEVYGWCKFFGHEEKAQVTLNSILAYDPAIPHWGYNGNARRYWDFLYGAKLSRIERQIHHYGSGMNAIPLLNEYREHPDDLYLLRVGYGGTMGAISNIHEDGFASAAFHSYPSTLKWDAYSGDYGPNFFGHAWNTGTYIVKTKEFGWQAFGGDIEVASGSVKVVPKDSFRKRVYLAPLGIYLTLEAGTFDSVSYNEKTGSVSVTLSGASEYCTTARLRIDVPAKLAKTRSFRPDGDYKQDALAYSIPLNKGLTEVKLIPVQR